MTASRLATEPERARSGEPTEGSVQVSIHVLQVRARRHRAAGLFRAFSWAVLLVPAAAFAQEPAKEKGSCAALDFLDGLEVLNAEGVPSLKTRWAHAYTKPLRIKTDNEAPVKPGDPITFDRMTDTENYQSY